MTAPLTAREMPIKNQMDNDPPDFIVSPYQKITCRIRNTTATTPPQNSGLCQMLTCSCLGIGVSPYTRSFNSASDFGLVIRLTTTVTMTQINQHHRARNMFCA